MNTRGRAPIGAARAAGATGKGAARPALQAELAALCVDFAASVEVVLFHRDTGFSEQCLVDPAAALDLAALGIAVPLQALYRDTGPAA